MYARVSEFRVPLEKLNEFKAAVESVVPLAYKEPGFRGLLVLKGEGSPVLARVISLWDSLEHLKASENSMYLYKALARGLEFSKGFPIMEENEVLVGALVAREPAPSSGRVRVN